MPKYRGTAFGLIRWLCLFCIFKKNLKNNFVQIEKDFPVG